MFNFRPTYQPLITFCKELIAEKKALMEENEELKKMLESTRQDLFYTRGQNRFLSESLADLQNEKRKDLEKRVADLEDRLCPPELRAESTEEKLEVGKWYNTTDFTKEKLEALLPVGTKVEVECKIHYLGINEKPPKETERCTVEEVVKGQPNQKTYIKVEERPIYKEWFKIIEE